MKKRQRALAAFLAIALILIPAPSAATYIPTSIGNDGAYSDKADLLNDLGLYSGTSTQIFTPDLGTTLTRETGIVMLLRIMGLESSAQSMSDTDVTAALSSFSDAASISNWAKRSVAYVVKNGITVGTGNGHFSPQGTLSGKAYCSLILRQLGYQVDYDSAPSALAAQGGLTASQAALFADKGSLIKDDLVGISFGALSATGQDGKTVVARLVENGTISQTSASDAGLAVTGVVTSVTTPVTTTTGGGSHHHSDPDVSITGLSNLETVIHDMEEIPFTVSPSGAAVSVICSDTDVIGEYEVTGSGITRTLAFQSDTTGSAILTVTAVADGYDTVTQSITVTVLDVFTVAFWEDFSDTLTPTPASIDLGGVTPYNGITFSFDYDPGVFDNPQITDSGSYYTLTVNPLSVGTADLTIYLEKDGYMTAEHVVSITIIP